MPIAIRSFAVAMGENDGNQIKRASQRIDDRPDPRIEDQRKGLFLESYNLIAVRLRIALTENAVGTFLCPFVEGVLEQWDLGIGPIDGGLSV
jgi:hypothetical protein